MEKGDANKNVFQNSPHVITAAALDANGKFSYYSDFGACIFVAAPSGLLSTDRPGSQGFNGGGSRTTPDPANPYYFPIAEYVNGIEGTSFSSPLVAGVLALVKQAQPRLDARFAKHLLARYCDKVDSSDKSPESDGGWKTNAAGISFNQNYGFGLINATRLIQMAPRYGGVTPLQTEASGTKSVNRAIPDNNANGISATCALKAITPLEEVQVALKITHPQIGDIEATLTSPRGTTSRLVMKDSGDFNSDMNWTFLSNAFWGENPSGTWTVKVKDLHGTSTGTWNTFMLTVRMGTLIQNSSAELIDYP